MKEVSANEGAGVSAATADKGACASFAPVHGSRLQLPSEVQIGMRFADGLSMPGGEIEKEVIARTAIEIADRFQVLLPSSTWTTEEVARLKGDLAPSMNKAWTVVSLIVLALVMSRRLGLDRSMAVFMELSTRSYKRIMEKKRIVRPFI